MGAGTQVTGLIASQPANQTSLAVDNEGRHRKCVVVTWFYPDQTGFLDFAYRIRALARHYDLTLLARAPLTQPELHIAGIEYHVLPTPNARRVYLLPYLLRVAKWLRRHKPVRVVFLGSQLALGSLFCPAIPSAVYWNEHPTHFYPSQHTYSLVRAYCWLGRFLTYLGARSASLVLPIGEAQQEDLLLHGCNPAQVRLQYMGVDASFVLPPAAPQGVSARQPLRLIYVGSISPARGRDLMLQALAIANRDKKIATLTLVGATEEQERICAKLADSLGIGDALTVVRRVAGHEVPSYLEGADFGLCLWEDREHWRYNPPTKLFEYLVAGLPVLASDIRTHTQYVHHGENGFIFAYCREGLAQAIREAWIRGDEMTVLKANAFASGKEYLWERIEPAFIDAMDHLGHDGEDHSAPHG